MQALLSTLFLVLTCSLCSVVWAETLKLELVSSRLPRLRSSHAAVYDGEDSIYIISGYNGTHMQTDVLKYSLESETIETVGTFPSGMNGGAVMHGEDILYFGGQTSATGSGINTITKFSTVDRNSTSGGTLTQPMHSMAVAWDSSTQLAYTFGGWYTARLNNVLRYNPANGQSFPVATLPQARYQAAAAWTRNGLGYVFGGSVTGTIPVPTSDIFEFDPVHGTVTRLNVTLPYNITNACAVSTGARVYVFGGRGGGVAYLDLLNHEVEAVDMNFYQLLEVSVCLYVPKLDRIYIIGGYGSYSGEADRARDEIFYIELGNRDPAPIDCSDGGLRVGPDPFCCTSFYICNAGEPKKVDCNNEMQFNPATLQCEDESVVKCKNNYYG